MTRYVTDFTVQDALVLLIVMTVIGLCMGIFLRIIR